MSVTNFTNSFNVTSWNEHILRLQDDNPCPPQQIEKSQNVFGFSVPAVKDPTGHVIDNTKCYYPAISDDPSSQHKDWTTAADACAVWIRGTANCPDCEGRLASFHSSEQEMSVWTTIRQSQAPDSGGNYWIGLRKHCTDCQFEWTDFTPTDYTNWGEGEPNNALDGEDCVAFTAWNGKWNDDNCNSKFNYICEIYDQLDSLPELNLDTNWPSMGGCKEGWLKYGKSCFKVIGKTENGLEGDQWHQPWQEADQFCGIEGSGGWTGATLAIFPNPYYNYYMAAMARKSGFDVWIGALSTTQDQTFHWRDNTRITFSNWAPGKPNGDFDSPKDCVRMRTMGSGSGPEKAGQWTDGDCLNENAFMCSHKLDPSMTSKNPSFCPDGWQMYDDFCLKLVLDPATWTEARGACKSIFPSKGEFKDFKSDLVSILDDYENNFLTSMFYSEESGFSMNFRGQPGAWIGFYGKTSAKGTQFNWVKKDFSNAYTNWGSSEPNMQHVSQGTEVPAYLGLGRHWITDSNAGSKRPYFCKASLPVSAPTDDRGDLLDCDADKGWYPSSTQAGHGHFCLKVFPEKKTFYESDHECQTIHGGHLVSIHGDKKNDAVVSAMANSPHGNGEYFWIGLQENQLNGFEWTDGGAVKYTNWAPEEPGIANNDKQRCAEIGEIGLWSVSSCSRSHPYICQNARPMENCVSTPKAERKPCGYVGITMEICVTDYQCCWDGTTSPLNCFHPGSRDTNQGSSGMTIAGAVFLSIFIWGTILAIVIMFFLQRKGVNLPFNLPF